MENETESQLRLKVEQLTKELEESKQALLNYTFQERMTKISSNWGRGTSAIDAPELLTVTQIRQLLDDVNWLFSQVYLFKNLLKSEYYPTNSWDWTR